MRDITKLHPILQYKLKLFLEECEKAGLKVGIGECVRTVQEQNALYAKGRTDKSSGIVTNCKGDSYSSPHQWGVAFDFYRNDGKGAYNDTDGFFRKVGQCAERVGLEWGGRWKLFVDKPHIQLPYWGSACAGKLKKRYGIPSKFDDLWYPNRPVGTVKSGSCRDDVLWVQYRLCMLTNNKELVPDGVFGPKTAEAITKYQESIGWNPSGKAGSKTINALSKYRVK